MTEGEKVMNRKKRIISIALTLILFFGATPAVLRGEYPPVFESEVSANSSNGEFTFVTTAGGICVTGYTDITTETLEIPEYILDQPVVEIADGAGVTGAFSNLSIHSLVLPDKLQKIGNNAFMGCDMLTSVTIPEQVNQIGSKAFANCNALTSINYNAANCTYAGIPGTYGNNEEQVLLTENVFLNCPATEINIGPGVQSLPPYIFAGLEQLTHVNFVQTETTQTELTIFKTTTQDLFLPNITSIGIRAFYNCQNLLYMLLPQSIINIGNSAFEGCAALARATIPAGVSYLPDRCFYGCSGLSDFSWAAAQKVIGARTFFNASSLVNFDFSGLIFAGQYAFASSGIRNAKIRGEAGNPQQNYVAQGVFNNCTSLIHVVIGSGISSISTQAFIGCTGLLSAVIPSNVTSIDLNAFDSAASFTLYCSQSSYANGYASQKGIASSSTFILSSISNQMYTTHTICPSVRVRVAGSAALSEGSDYAVSYSNNINVGVAGVNVVGRGDYSMLAASGSFRIIERDINTLTVVPVAVQRYTGEAVTPKITIKNSGTVLRESTDYVAYYNNNTNGGTATATVYGRGNYTGSIIVKFEISENQFDWFFSWLISLFLSIFM